MNTRAHDPIKLPYPVFDADNHYYEALDAFTRHLDPRFHRGLWEWIEVKGRRYPLVGGKIDRSVSNPTFDPIAKPGAMLDYYKGNPDGRPVEEFMRDRERIPAYYRNPEARLAKMDEQGVDQNWLFPTLGGLYEEPIKKDPRNVTRLYRAFNEWLHDDWGFNFKNRIFAAPYVSLADPDDAVRTLEWALQRNARLVVMRPCAPTTRDGQLSPGHPTFDPFWARVNEAGITVATHAANTGYTFQGYLPDDGYTAMMDASLETAWRFLHFERPIYDFCCALILDRLFERFPNVRVVSVENGASFLDSLFYKLQFMPGRMPGYFKQSPLETFREHVWISPFSEDNIARAVELMGADRVLFGSDWPHVEGLHEPLDFLEEIKNIDETSRRKIMGENARGLNTPRLA